MKQSGALSPNEQLEILAMVWDIGEPGYVFLPWIPGNASTKDDRRSNWNEGPAFVWPGERDKIYEWLVAHQKDDLYFSVNKFTSHMRITQHVAESHVLFADLDEVDPSTDIEADMRPSIAWESSPNRFQAVWLMNSMEWDACEPGGYNNRLTIAIGADVSGWDVTQVLRVPGKRNFKFSYWDEDADISSVPGRLLWHDKDKKYDWTFFDDRLPHVKTYDDGTEIEEAEIDSIDRYAVWSRVRLKVSSNVRDYMSLRSRDVDSSDHDRSEVLWQIERDLADAGCTVAEIIAVVRGTPWNKYAGRRNEMAQLKAEAQKAKGISSEAHEESLEEAAYSATRPKILPTLAMLTEQSIPRPHWLIRNIWTHGSCGFISGAPKSYKSYAGLDMAISVATGKSFLNDPQFIVGRAMPVIYVQEEDSLPLVLHRAEQVLEGKAPERHWHGQLMMPNVTPGGGGDSEPTAIWEPPTPLANLAMLIRSGFIASDSAWQAWLLDQIASFKAKLVVIDTLGTTVGDIDTDKSGQLNEKVLRPLKAITEATNCAIAVVHHNRKTVDNGRSGQQMLGSVALHAWVESALYFQSKEKMTDKPYSEVKVERENKLAEDLRFRIRIPTMWQEKGDHTEQGESRQVWQPEVLNGWAETTEGDPEIIADSNKKFGQGGLKLYNKMGEADLTDGWYEVAEIADILSMREWEVTKQLENGRTNNRFKQNAAGLWRLM